MLLYEPIEKLPGTSPVTFNKLHRLDIYTFFDLLSYFPTRYENYSLISPIAKLQEGEVVTIQGTITESKNVYTKKGMTLQKVTLADESGKIELVWYNQPYLTKLFTIGTKLSVAGSVTKFLNTHSLEVKEYEVLKHPGQPTIHTGRIVPVYPEKKGTSTKTIREKIFKALNLILHNQSTQSVETIEWLPKDIITMHKLIAEFEAYQAVHFPDSVQHAELARQRLSFDELFTIQLSTALVKEEWSKEKVTHPFSLAGDKASKLQTFIENLPFTLTTAQQKVKDEIIEDLLKEKPMNRFLEGDVGSGKTVIATIASYISYLNGFQVLIMAPTEILAQQHYHTISRLTEKLNIKIGLHTGSKKLDKKIDSSQYDIFVGTHALITDKMQFDTVGLVVIDEQHRFGVAQRAKLKQKGINPHLLTMTATPIPRTVALTLYGELDLSVIDEMPQGRLPIKTYLVPPLKRDSAYSWMNTEIETHGTQAFIICPLIEESEHETMNTVKAAKKEYEYLKNNVFKNWGVGLLHGKMKGKEKDTIMQEFKDKKYMILVSTSVVEVGIDVPNATIMVIEGAERYGLAQLHQLRGRVGRGNKQSYCLLFTSGQEKSNGRLEFFAKTLSGLRLAEFDFKIRGPGHMYGTQQHGHTELKIADLTNMSLIDQTKRAVSYFLKNYRLDDHQAIKDKIKAYQIQQIARD